ncbi:hypothetical protein COU12_00625 [Candidatus Jorgensenbacteria bacterium CG10_big_fil_rev_8_21_14_0_10_54_38]|uniref:Metallopeptidase family protein n=2 Tax=Candidatus Joergenseniibacteriota TaxID=1752739 RepID=A0A2M6WGJ8_9BACT|nr:MAG: hypothetical protein COX26_01985 [Candidatus Jorgensenbacteria bacterium CG23_combo_of_CG06-09_8_20_14_all_54_14]PIT91909.1 MAG: hypothetical protein COU12_00625 [Candidatus Jorgensenbacteria bacterium CG10_big_fil_rev_8_21_14_0_10_54_38]
MHFSRGAFEKLVADGIARIPARFLRKLKNVAVIVENEPTPEQLKSVGMGNRELLLGLYEGVADAEGGHTHRAFPDRITLFRRPIEAVARGGGDVARVVAETVRHEVAHHFGMDECEVRRAEHRGACRRLPPARAGGAQAGPRVV